MAVKKAGLMIIASLAVSIWFCSLATEASALQATGEFAAKKACNAYQSRTKQTNPDKTKLEPGKKYTIVEVDKAGSPVWYRIKVDKANPQERWVSFECGTPENLSVSKTAEGTTKPPKSGGHGPSVCRTAGLGDSYVLALSWQPAFCEGHQSKPECAVNDPQVYQANNFTLHGLWPNKQSCGINYGFCGKYKAKQDSFCTYEAISVDEATDKELKKVMPSAAHGSCLERHEWHKHGTCQKTWDADGYFDTAIRLVEEFNKDGMAALMSSNIDKTISVTAFRETLEKNLGAGASDRIRIKCDQGQLVDVEIDLPAELPAEDSLKDLIRKAHPVGFKNNKCGTAFKVDPIGQ